MLEEAEEGGLYLVFWADGVWEQFRWKRGAGRGEVCGSCANIDAGPWLCESRGWNVGNGCIWEGICRESKEN